MKNTTTIRPPESRLLSSSPQRGYKKHRNEYKLSCKKPVKLVSCSPVSSPERAHATQKKFNDWFARKKNMHLFRN